MIGTVVNIFRIQDLRNKILFTVALLAIYRIGFHIPLPGFDQRAGERYPGQACLLLKGIGRRQPGDAAADDDDVVGVLRTED